MRRFIGQLAALTMIVRRSLRQHALSSAVTVLSIALGCGLVMAVFTVNYQAERAFTGGELGFDAVLGARGSKLQLVLNTVFHLETSPGNIPWKLYTAIKADRRVEMAIPYAVGDNYHGFRLVGTTEELFTRFEYQAGRKFQPEPGGRMFDPARREAVIGSTVAQLTGLKIGAKINPYHGLTYNEQQRHPEEYLIAGVLAPTNSPSDRVIWIPIEGIFRMTGHQLRGGGESYVPRAGEAIPDESKEVSAVMLKLRGGPQVGFKLDQEINMQGDQATLAWPIASVMTDLFAKIGWMSKILEVVAYLVVVVAAASILASIYNTMNERRRELAILRALGARRRTLMAAIILEASSIAAAGSLVGFVVYAAIVLAASEIIRSQTGVVLALAAWHPSLALTPISMTALGALAGVLPALRAYRTDVASNLVPSS